MQIILSKLPAFIINDGRIGSADLFDEKQYFDFKCLSCVENGANHGHFLHKFKTVKTNFHLFRL